MYFKSLDIYGFKSFADKTKITFEPGITAIVGPNGCGKSNIVDSLRWVLGEQSAKDLRGISMEDVIFNGTDTQDPVGFAEVTLTLSNESKFLPVEYDEVMITRRLFRSGESEYLLNKNQVRLKDILDIIMGTGIGASAYSIIAQGKIDMIISSKPEDRRFIFEEASGIIKYKSRKREAVRKLEYTENNLLRVNDIIEEVKRQINSIERQARKAERYREEFERLKALDTKVAAWNLRNLTLDKEKAETDVSDNRNNESTLLNEVSELSSKLADLKAKLAEVATRLSAAQIEEVNLNSTIDRSGDKINLNTERQKELDVLKQTLLSEQRAIQKTIAELEETVSNLRKETESTLEERTRKERLLSEKETRFKELETGIDTNGQNMRDAKLKTVDTLASQSKIKNDSARLSSDLSNYSARQRRLKTEEEKVGTEATDAQNRLTRVDGQITELDAKIRDNEVSKAALESELEQKNDVLSGVEKKAEDLQANRLSMESRLSVLKDMIKRYEGFKDGSKAILLDRGEGRLSVEGVHGALVELINVKKGYELAVEASLGDLLQCIVVENKSTALELINHLRNNRLGKATIVSLDSIAHSEEWSSTVTAQEGVLGKLGDFIEIDERFKNLISVLFHNVYLARDMDRLFNSQAGIAEDVRYVTLNGDIVENGFVTGGSIKGDIDMGLLNRKIQIQELEANCIAVKQEEAELNAKEELLDKEVNGLTENIDAKDAALRQDELDMTNKRSQKRNIEESLSKIREELSLLRLELSEVEEEITSLKAKQIQQTEGLKRLEEEHATLQNLIASAQAFIESGLREKEGLLIEITQMKTELLTTSEQEKGFLADLKMREEFLNNQKGVLSEKQRGYNESVVRQDELKVETAALEQVIKESVEKRDRVSLEFTDVKDKKSDLAILINQTEAEYKEKEARLNELKDKLHSFSMALQENSFKIESLKTRISQTYKIELDQLDIPVEEQLDLEGLMPEIDALKQKIERMGPVNLVAIEEHQELKERYDFLTKQEDDLNTAKESLLAAIKKINRTTRELFMDTFQKVREEFKGYFRYMFGGGQAELVLMDDQDVLECGIEIMARPPGKKLQSISLLSGGEKALTAIALLFSIFKIKPSPFCILDEVDAPLDESNVGRFTKMLSDFTKTSQFIIVTHNKRTISMADVMYGITMERSGISKVVSVKFAKGEQKQQPVLSDSPK